MPRPEFSELEQYILELLSDGRGHSKQEIHRECFDESTTLAYVAKAVCLLRKKLERRNETILCEYKARQLKYRHVRLITNRE